MDCSNNSCSDCQVETIIAGRIVGSGSTDFVGSALTRQPH